MWTEKQQTVNYRRNSGFLLLALVVGAVFALLAYLSTPSPQVIETGRAGTAVFFAADDARMWYFDGCMEVYWQVEGVKGVLLNDLGVIGADERQVCGVDARLRIIAQDDTEHEYWLTQEVVFAQSGFRLVALALIGLAGVGVWLIRGGTDSLGLTLLLVFLFALALRLVPLDTPLTTDETALWMRRSRNFLAGVLSGEFLRTSQTLHPGVTTMWIGSLGWWLRNTTLGGIEEHYLVTRSLVTFFFPIVNALIVLAGYGLLRRLLDARVALLAALLWAAEPFLIAHAQIMHTDSLMTGFMALSLLALLIAFRLDERGLASDAPPLNTTRTGWLVASGVLAGLASLTKITAFMLIPIAGLIALLIFWRPRRGLRNLPVLPLLLWGGMIVLIWFILYPALWVDVGRVIEKTIEGVRHGSRPHEMNTYFLGAARDDPGFLFYWFVLGLRITPWVFAGVLLGLIAAAHAWQTRAAQMIGVCFLYALMLMLMLSLQAKKLDRYILIVFPALVIAAAYGWHWLAALAVKRMPLLQNRRAQAGAWVVVIALLTGNVAAYAPYTLSYYNPLLGGGAVASQTINTGWGEGLDVASRYLNDIIEDCRDDVMMTWRHVGEHHIRCNEVKALGFNAENIEGVRYMVFYIDALQSGRVETFYDPVRDLEPIHVVRLHGVEYAYIYDVSDIDLMAYIRP